MKYRILTPLFISGLLFSSACKSDHKKAKEEYNLFQGKTERDQISVVTKVPGKVEKILAEEGVSYKKGDLLFILEIPEVDAKKSQAEGAVSSAQAQYEMAKKGATDNQIKQLRAKVAGLKEQHDFAQKSNQRMYNMLRDSLISQQTYDEVYAKYQGAKNQYLAAQAELADAINGARIEQQQMALGQKERALGALQEVDVAEQEKYIRAPQDLTIETINLKIGELALPGYSIANGILDYTTYFRFTIPENKIGQLSKNQIVVVTIPYKNNLKIKSKIVSIKALSAYANISTAYPDFDQQQTLYEIKVVPVNPAQAMQILSKTNVLLNLNDQ
ncbi:HlyD family secretion protein [Weeksella sp. HMSC059D05]|uniref:HlyD family secretion protein n=1 Tax=Weeksella sp. HMSC059D05 TaxID=1715139 RepID=UPI0008A5617B|nr:biotin/lipoyl-binding protein [Weeksella sp. HMSC059D05]OFM84499.1 ABC transporter permease [Weeksella sp. HMSC059D05]